MDDRVRSVGRWHPRSPTRVNGLSVASAIWPIRSSNSCTACMVRGFKHNTNNSPTTHNTQPRQPQRKRLWIGAADLHPLEFQLVGQLKGLCRCDLPLGGGIARCTHCSAPIKPSSGVSSRTRRHTHHRTRTCTCTHARHARGPRRSGCRRGPASPWVMRSLTRSKSSRLATS